MRNDDNVAEDEEEDDKVAENERENYDIQDDDAAPRRAPYILCEFAQSKYTWIYLI